MGFALSSLGVLCGGPGAGGILATHGGSDWIRVWTFAGVVTCASGLGFLNFEDQGVWFWVNLESRKPSSKCRMMPSNRASLVASVFCNNP